MERVYNFSAGPAVLPLPVLEKASKQMVNYEGSGMSVMEMSHRSKMYEEIIGRSESLLRELLTIPDNYKVLFLQGGASTQFAMLPLNLLKSSQKADYVNTGMWSKRAIAECKKFGTVNVVATSEDATFNYIPTLDSSTFDKDADYFHITLNNTIYGTKFSDIPNTNGVPLATDMSSCILSEPIDVSRFGVIYAGAQKNMGPSGLTAVIIRDDLIGDNPNFPKIPTMMSYKIHADNDSMYNTPPTYAVYIAMLVFEWLKDLGGLKEMQKINVQKAGLLYDYLDASSFFNATVTAPHRSLMNIPFLAPNDELNAKFVKEATGHGFQNLKGHRSVGGMRASIYNACPTEWVSALVDFMKRFEVQNRL